MFANHGNKHPGNQFFLFAEKEAELAEGTKTIKKLVPNNTTRELLEKRLKHEIELYEFAKAHFYKQKAALGLHSLSQLDGVAVY